VECAIKRFALVWPFLKFSKNMALELNCAKLLVWEGMRNIPDGRYI
jgi:hypothetical protein